MADLGRHFERYRGIIPDFEHFLEALRREPASHVRINRKKAEPEAVTGELKAHGLEANPEPWMENLLRVSGKGALRLGATLAHALGHYYVQSASSAVSAVAMNAGRGDRVLDLCAAPGSKTTFLAEMAGDEGLVVANEPSPKRLNSLIANLRRMGLSNVVVTSYAGQNFPVRMMFDRILVDAPCSGEGTWVGRDARPNPMTGGQRENLAARQAAILDRACRLLATGGEMVYSTCTYAPEENELVVAGAIERHGMEVIDLGLDLRTCPGLTEWEGRALPPSLARAARLYPHYFDSEGFFVARLVKPR